MVTTLEGLWPYRWLLRDSQHVVRTFVLFYVAAVVIALGFGVFAQDRVADDFRPVSTLGRIFAFAMPIASAASNLVVFYLLCRFLDASVRRLIDADASLAGLAQQLRPSHRVIWVSFLCCVPLYLWMLTVYAAINDRSLPEHLVHLFNRDWVNWVNHFIMLPAWVATSGFLIIVFATHISVLRTAAARIPIDLMNLQRYTPVSEPFVRTFVAGALFLSIVQVLKPMVDENATEIFTTNLESVIVLIFGLALALFVGPVWTLRNRIREAKHAQLDAIAARVSGGDTDGVTILGEGVELLTTDQLLTRQMFIESRWEWPIATHMQQLVLFGLLPPLTWVMAAVVENLLY